MVERAKGMKTGREGTTKVKEKSKGRNTGMEVRSHEYKGRREVKGEE